MAGEVGSQVKEVLFDKVVIAIVSKKPNFDNIQDEIAKELDFKMKDGEGNRRSKQEFWSRLQEEKRILLQTNTIKVALIPKSMTVVIKFMPELSIFKSSPFFK